MIRLIAVAGFALSVATSVQGTMTVDAAVKGCCEAKSQTPLVGVAVALIRKRSAGGIS
jgi:hypothetical protein